MAHHISWPEIGQFRNTVKTVVDSSRYKGKDENGNAIYDPSAPLPKITFTGTVKLHGTNASVVWDVATGEEWTQSRNNVITPTSDNAGFSHWYFHVLTQEQRDSLKKQVFDRVKLTMNPEKGHIALFGEWCGSGIQKGVAISELEKMFVVFGVKYVIDEDFNYWMPHDEFATINIDEARIFNIRDFQTWELEVDFEHPELVQNKLVEITNEVERECPVGKHFGVSGVGEGVVWAFYDCRTLLEFGVPRFKVKGEKHSVSKVKTLAAVDTEKMNSINQFVEYACTENRMKQGLDFLAEQKLEPIPENIGTFLRWLANDIFKEEKDVMAASGLQEKDLGKMIANKARKWYFAQ